MCEKKEALRLIRDSRDYSYLLYYTYGKEFLDYEVVSPEESIKSVDSKDSNYESHFCFSDYLYKAPEDKPSNRMQKVRFLPLILDMEKTLDACGTTSVIEKSALFKEYYDKYFNKLISTLNNYIETCFDKKSKFLYVFPREAMSKLYLLTFLVKLRTLFESPYVQIETLTPIFKEDFPELTEEEIAYLLHVFVYGSGNHHGFFRGFNNYGGSFNGYTKFRDMMKLAYEEKRNSINGNDGYGKVFQTNEISFSLFTGSETTSGKYEKVVEKKDILINNYIKV